MVTGDLAVGHVFKKAHRTHRNRRGHRNELAIFGDVKINCERGRGVRRDGYRQQAGYDSYSANISSYRQLKRASIKAGFRPNTGWNGANVNGNL